MRIVHVSYSLEGGAGRYLPCVAPEFERVDVDSFIFALDEGITTPPTFKSWSIR